HTYTLTYWLVHYTHKKTPTLFLSPSLSLSFFFSLLLFFLCLSLCFILSLPLSFFCDAVEKIVRPLCSKKECLLYFTAFTRVYVYVFFCVCVCVFVRLMCTCVNTGS